jgi:organic hydroperoxide reductase OsmC/OhrA
LEARRPTAKPRLGTRDRQMGGDRDVLTCFHRGNLKSEKGDSMKISARVANRCGEHTVSLRTQEREHSLMIPAKADGLGSSTNGGELLFLALATCYCNDIYREAKRRGIEVERVQVEVTGEFGAEGEGAREIRYSASVDAKSPRDEVLALMRHTDRVAEIHNTLRVGAAVVLSECEAQEV